MTVERGGVYWVFLGDPEDPSDESVSGHEQGFRRPGIVLQNDSDNHSATTTVIVPTTRGGPDEATHLNQVFLSEGTAGLPYDSVALCRQIRAIDIEDRVDEKIGDLPNEKLRVIESAVSVSLQL